jgi:hypothetical protein
MGHPAFAWGRGAQQVPPLRYAPVGMTSLFWVLEFWCANQLVIPTGA